MSASVVLLHFTSALGRGCVETRYTAVPRNIDVSERAVFDYFHVRKGERTPENEMDARFHTASVVSGRSGSRMTREIVDGELQRKKADGARTGPGGALLSGASF
jgi:hypothetical protein